MDRSLRAPSSFTCHDHVWGLVRRHACEYTRNEPTPRARAPQCPPLGWEVVSWARRETRAASASHESWSAADVFIGAIDRVPIHGDEAVQNQTHARASATDKMRHGAVGLVVKKESMQTAAYMVRANTGGAL
jgi:hypothetical protein